MKNNVTKLSLFTFLCLLLVFSANAQQKSPAKTAEGEVEGAQIQINYGSPAVRDRPIWGELVPYDQVWRSGANEATTFVTDSEIMVENERLEPGTYSLFTIPGHNEWIIIFNRKTGQWGTQYEETEDALRVKVTPEETGDMTEDLTYEIEDDGFRLKWERVEVPVKISKAD